MNKTSHWAYRSAAREKFDEEDIGGPGSFFPTPFAVVTCWAYEEAKPIRDSTGVWVPAWIWVPDTEAVRHRLTSD